MFNRFKDDLKKYWKYAIYSSKAQLKSENSQFLSELDLVGA